MSEDAQYFAGWDVGGWNCDRNSSSRDAIVILDGAGQIVGLPFRGNLRESINAADSTREWIQSLFALCQSRVPEADFSFTMAIDTPLGFSNEFRDLINRGGHAQVIGESADNPYLNRETERFLFSRGYRPLSPVKDMIGSQATKGMHVLSRFAPSVESCGVWSDGHGLRIIEGYPTVCRKSAMITGLRCKYGKMPHQDIEDALLCALLARLFVEGNQRTIPPPGNIPESEGWIWVPADAVSALADP